MTDTTKLAFVLAVLLFTAGVLLFIQFFPRKAERPLYMKVVIDANDYATFDAVMSIISNYDLMDGGYFEEDTCSCFRLAVSKEDYTPILKSIQALPNAEVI